MFTQREITVADLDKTALGNREQIALLPILRLQSSALMIVAPLMTPIMATTAALIMGNIRRALQRLALVVIGVIIVIFISWLFGLLYADGINFNTNAQIVARISPRLIDLVAALASGAAGAFCLSRDDIADSLPGVAISISLVPPLCVVGISASAAEWDAASGALLLFITNFLAILLAGGAILAILGLNSAANNEIKGTARRKAFALVLVAVLLVAVPLLITGQKISKEAILELQSQRVAAVWVDGTEYRVREVKASGDSVHIVVIGQGDPPQFENLVTDIESAVGRPLTVELETLPSVTVSNSEP